MASNNVKTGIFPLFTNDSQRFLASLRVVGMNVDKHKPAAKKNTTATKDEAGEPHRQLRIICRRKRHPKERNIYVWSFDTYYKLFLVLSNFIPRPSIIRHLNSSLNFILVLLLFTPLICLLLFYEIKKSILLFDIDITLFFLQTQLVQEQLQLPKNLEYPALCVKLYLVQSISRYILNMNRWGTNNYIFWVLCTVTS